MLVNIKIRNNVTGNSFQRIFMPLNNPKNLLLLSQIQLK